MTQPIDHSTVSSVNTASASPNRYGASSLTPAAQSVGSSNSRSATSSRSTESRFITLQSDELKQQQLKSVQPILTPLVNIVLLMCVAFVFMPLGFWILDGSSQIVSKEVRYDNKENCKVDGNDNSTTLPKQCMVNFTISEKMSSPVYFSYRITNFHQMHRRYLKSKSDDQLMGDDLRKTGVCDPIKTQDDRDIYPCGLVAALYMPDRFAMSVNGQDLCDRTSKCVDYGNDTEAWQDHWDEWNQEPNWSNNHISWKTGRQEKYQFENVDTADFNFQSKFQIDNGLRLPQVNDTDLQVWMKSSHLSDFQKLHRVIKDRSLSKGDKISVTIMNWFDSDEYDSEKYIVLSTASWVGGPNYFIAWMFISIAILAIVCALLFTALLFWGERRMRHEYLQQLGSKHHLVS